MCDVTLLVTPSLPLVTNCHNFTNTHHPSKRDIIYGRPPSGFGSEVSRFESRFHQGSIVYVGQLHYKSDVKRLPAGVVRKLGDEVSAQVLFSSFDWGSKLQGPS
ncbi:hypothetical protein AVEN_272387-1 [Araneus ventricosus]|uniref:Uncharacterized protein n=1 Tax=Araneus ventricosus TaxID=182803 RepID=A0A4Y2I013_ARAVE|nr:hypothetical protein AVEN_272387-1 [Araneus ventricosus]